jgi:hypothetical protein
MTCEEVYEEIDKLQKTAMSFHKNMADYFDFLGLMGFKRVHEYHYLKECIQNRRIERYYINHHNELLGEDEVKEEDIIPNDWYKYTRFDVTSSIKQKAIKSALDDYRNLVKNMKEKYSEYVNDLYEMNEVADANLISKLVEYKDRELKCVDRMMIKLNGTDYDMIYIAMIQPKLHKKYKKKTNKIGVKIC